MQFLKAMLDSSQHKNQISERIPEKTSCYYWNQTRQVQIVRIQSGGSEWLERTVFPNKYFDFNAPINSQLEVYTYAIATSVLCDRIPCQQLSQAVKNISES
jgi:hypothetical protein